MRGPSADAAALQLDHVYEDPLNDAIPEDLWTSKSAALQDELRQVRTEMERHAVARQADETAGLQILGLTQTAYSRVLRKSALTGTLNHAGIELHIRSRKSFFLPPRFSGLTCWGIVCRRYYGSAKHEVKVRLSAMQ